MELFYSFFSADTYQFPDEETKNMLIKENCIALSNVENTNLTLTKLNVWDKNQMIQLLELCTKNKDRLTNPKYRKTEVYKEIAVEMQRDGNSFSAEQCSNQMKTLTTKYKEVKDYNSRSGNYPKVWEYFEMVADYVGDRPGITPKVVCLSISVAKPELNKDSCLLNLPSTSSTCVK